VNIHIIGPRDENLRLLARLELLNIPRLGRDDARDTPGALCVRLQALDGHRRADTITSRLPRATKNPLRHAVSNDGTAGGKTVTRRHIQAALLINPDRRERRRAPRLHDRLACNILETPRRRDTLLLQSRRQQAR